MRQAGGACRSVGEKEQEQMVTFAALQHSATQMWFSKQMSAKITREPQDKT